MKLVGFLCLLVESDKYVHPKGHIIGFGCKVKRTHIGVCVWNTQRLKSDVQKDCAETTVLAQYSDALVKVVFCRGGRATAYCAIGIGSSDLHKCPPDLFYIYIKQLSCAVES
eukprot:13857245-Ditylum_brightwellii.AAC.1